MTVFGSIVVSIPACHAGDPGSIPGRRASRERTLDLLHAELSCHITWVYMYTYMFKQAAHNVSQQHIYDRNFAFRSVIALLGHSTTMPVHCYQNNPLNPLS